MRRDLSKKIMLLLIIVLIIPIYSGNGYGSLEKAVIISQGPRTTQWILDLQNNALNNTQWYFDHLNDIDRTKIRQAMDWAIPRDYIINTIEDGFAEPTLTPLVHYSGPILDNGTVPRNFNLTKASDILTEVFGYRYNQFTNNASTEYDETRPYFMLTQLVPPSDPKRIQFANEIKLNWQKIGIKVNQQELDTSLLSSYDGPKDFDHGGFDIYFIGSLEWDALPGVVQIYRGLDPVVDNNIDTAIGYNWNPNETIRNQNLLDIQQWIYDNVPVSYIFRYLTLNVRNKNLMGFNPFTQFNYENWTFLGKNAITLALNAPWSLDNLNPLFNYESQLVGATPYDADSKYVIGSVFRGMFFSTTEENDSTMTKWHTYPYFADWYNTSADGLTWFVNLKEGLKWHDGVDLNASDVEFTFNSILSNSSTFNYNEDYKFFIKSVSVINSTLLKFEFNHTWLLKETFLSTSIIPKHIFENIPMNEWADDITNTGLNATIVGNGPYTFVNKSSDLSSVYLEKWDYWNSSYNTLIKNNKMGETVPGVNVPSINSIKLAIIANDSIAIEGIKNGTIDAMLGTVLRAGGYPDISPITDPAIPIFYPSLRTQQIVYNLYSPIWGMIPSDPSKLYPKTVNTSSIITTSPSSTSSTAGFEILSPILAILSVAVISVYSRKKKKM